MQSGAKESPFGVPIAHGFLTLSLLPPMMRKVPGISIVGHKAGVNSGAESLRFLAPVPIGSKIAAELASLEPPSDQVALS